jgi:hypothetical protein
MWRTDLAEMADVQKSQVISAGGLHGLSVAQDRDDLGFVHIAVDADEDEVAFDIDLMGADSK